MIPVLVGRLTVVGLREDDGQFGFEAEECKTPEEFDKALWRAAYDLDKRRIVEYTVITGQKVYRVKNLWDHDD